jgi:hypothetical protein
MKLIITFFFLFLCFVGSLNAQSQTISKEEYDRAFRFAVTETNAAFPFVFTVTTDSLENGRIVSSVIDVNERESERRERITRMTVADGKTRYQYQTKVDFGKNFCSEDGESWTPSKYECFGPVNFYGPREPESVEYSLTEKSVNGEKVKTYRQYSVFPITPSYPERNFREKIATIDYRGFFISIVDTEGTLDPKTVTLTRKQSWDADTKIRPIVSPIK